MHILLLTDGISPYVTGGMQRHSANLAKYFSLNGVKVTLVHCLPFGSKLPSEDEVNLELFQDDHFKLHKIYALNFPKSGRMIGHYIKESYAYSKNIYELLDFQEFDFVYAKGFCGWYYLEQKKKGVKLPPIGVKFHGYEMYQELSSFSQKLKAKLLRKPTKWNNEHADFVFSYGGKITELILQNFKVKPNHVIEFSSGIDNDWVRQEELVSNNNEVNFVFVGRDERRKGLAELTIAIKQILGEVDFKFHFVGPIPEGKRIKDKSIVYHGELKTKEGVVKVLDMADVLVCPSHSEGMPNVILEGMARGLAILATDVGAIEFIVDDSNGMIISVLNQIELNDSLRKMASLNVESLLLLRNNSLSKIKSKYLWDKLSKNIIEEIKKVI